MKNEMPKWCQLKTQLLYIILFFIYYIMYKAVYSFIYYTSPSTIHFASRMDPKRNYENPHAEPYRKNNLQPVIHSKLNHPYLSDALKLAVDVRKWLHRLKSYDIVDCKVVSKLSWWWLCIESSGNTTFGSWFECI